MKRLKAYTSIAWDFDGTLVDHDQSDMFAKFIAENPFKQDFHIVTFRSHGMQYEIESDLEDYGLTKDMFRSIHNIPDVMYEAFERALANHDHQAIWDYRTWKGKICKEIGAGLLIDDMSEHVYGGCAHYDVDYLHPNELSPIE